MRSVLRSRLALAVMAIAVAAGYLTLPAARGADSTEAAVGNPVKIMFVGDSITSGRACCSNEWPTFRAKVYELLDRTYNLNFVGSQSGIDSDGNSIPNAQLTATDPHHEGHNGWRIDELINGNPTYPASGRLADWMAAQNPDVVVLYGGANDFNAGEQATEVYDDLVEAIGVIRSVKGDTRIVVTNHHPPQSNPARDAQIAVLNPFIPRLQDLSTPSSPIVTVDIHTGYPSPDPGASGSHPGPDGQFFIAERIAEVLDQSGLLRNSTPPPTVNSTSTSVNRGQRGVEIDLTGTDLFANVSATAGAGVTVARTTWNSRTSVTVTVDVDVWATPGKRNIVLTNPDGDTVTCSNCLDVKSQQVAPPLKIMMLGGETTSGRMGYWDYAAPSPRLVGGPNEEPTFRGDLYTLLENHSPSLQVDFVGSQSGIDSEGQQALPLTTLGDLDHEGHREWHIEQLLASVDGWLDSANPDVVVLFAGQQDVRVSVRNGVESNNEVMSELGQVVDRIRAHNPNARIVVTNLNEHKDSVPINNVITAYNNYFAAYKGTRFTSTASSPITTADVSGASINDNTYPNQSGNDTIATAIYNALSSAGMLAPVPQAPGPVNGASTTAGVNQLTVNWSAPTNPTAFTVAPITGYKVTLNNGGGTKDVGAGTTSAAFTGLDPAKTYTATITATNDRGTSPAVQVSGKPDAPATPPPAASGDADGYWMVRSGGSVYAFGGATDFGSPTLNPGTTAVAITGHPAGTGYWVLGSDGTVYPRGAAVTYPANNPAVLSPGETYTSIAAHPSGNGYWLFTSKGRVITHGNAGHFQDLVTLGVNLNAPVIASAPTAAGDGYLMVAADGGVFAFPTSNTTLFQGSIQSVINDQLKLVGIAATDWLQAPIVGIVPTPTGGGYWMIASDGGVFGFGDAGFRGSVPGALNGGLPASPIQGMVAFGTEGYIAVGGDGGLFAFCSFDCYMGSLPDVNVGPYVPGISDVTSVAASFNS